MYSYIKREHPCIYISTTSNQLSHRRSVRLQRRWRTYGLIGGPQYEDTVLKLRHFLHEGRKSVLLLVVCEVWLEVVDAIARCRVRGLPEPLDNRTVVERRALWHGRDRLPFLGFRVRVIARLALLGGRTAGAVCRSGTSRGRWAARTAPTMCGTGRATAVR